MLLRLFILLVLISSSPFVFAQSPPAPTPAQRMLTGLGLIAPAQTLINYTGSTAPQPLPFAIHQQRLQVSTPIIRDDTQALTLSLNGQWLNFDASPVLASTQTLLAENFYKVELGGQYSHREEGGRSWAVRFASGSASDRLFSESRDTTFSVAASYLIPRGDERYWLWSLFISNNSPLGNYVPIPGFIYLMSSEKWTAALGIPLISVRWMPSSPWSFSTTIFGPSLTAEAAWGPAALTFQWGPQMYLRRDRLNRDDRLYFEETRLFTSLKFPTPWPVLFGEIQAGHSFNRSVYEGESLSDRDRGSSDLKDSWFTALSLRCLF